MNLTNLLSFAFGVNHPSVDKSILKMYRLTQSKDDSSLLKYMRNAGSFVEWSVNYIAEYEQRECSNIIPTQVPNGKQQKNVRHDSHTFHRSIVLNLTAHAIEYEHCAKIRIDNEIPKNVILSLL